MCCCIEEGGAMITLSKPTLQQKESAFSPTALLEECPPPSRQGEPKVLKLVYLELTPKCNNRCPGCINESFIENFSQRSLNPSFRSPFLKREEWQEVLSRLPNTVEAVILSGGEPTLHPEFTDILHELTQRGLPFAIFTNGRWPHPDRLLNTLRTNKEFQGFLISLHGTTHAVHDAFVGVAGAFNETVTNMQRAVQTKRPVAISMVIHRQNLHEVGEMPFFALDLGVQKVTFNRYLSTPERFKHTDNPIDSPSDDELRDAIRQIETLRSQLKGRLQISYGPTIPQCFEPSSAVGCSAGEAAIVIDPWGNIKPCLHSDLLCGNILQQDFQTIWTGNALRAWRETLNPICATCPLLSTCGGGCRAMLRAWGNNKDPLMKIL